MKDHEYFVYIVCSRTGTLYIGMTNSIYHRALEHKRGEIEGFASKYGCDRLVYHESFDDVHKALGRETQLKGWRRSKKIALIEAKNPRWADLAESWGSQMAFAGESINNADLKMNPRPKHQCPVILSVVTGSRSEAVTKSKDPHSRVHPARTPQEVLTTYKARRELLATPPPMSRPAGSSRT